MITTPMIPIGRRYGTLESTKYHFFVLNRRVMYGDKINPGTKSRDNAITEPNTQFFA